MHFLIASSLTARGSGGHSWCGSMVYVGLKALDRNVRISCVVSTPLCLITPRIFGEQHSDAGFYWSLPDGQDFEDRRGGGYKICCEFERFRLRGGGECTMTERLLIAFDLIDCITYMCGNCLLVLQPHLIQPRCYEESFHQLVRLMLQIYRVCWILVYLKELCSNFLCDKGRLP